MRDLAVQARTTKSDRVLTADAGQTPSPELPCVSVLIVSYNSRAYLDDCLESLRVQKGVRFEVILVDNASTDGSASSVEQRFPEVRLIRSEKNLGFGAGNNLGARQAKGDYLAFLNPDTIAEPWWLQSLLSALEAHGKAGLATSQILLLGDPERINTCGNDIHLSGLTLCRGMGADRDAFAAPSEVSAVSGASFAISRELFEELGGFDKTFFLYVEDTDLSLRARLAGSRCLYVPDSVVYHDYRLRLGSQKTYYQERNRYLLLLKTLRWRTLGILLPALLLAEVVTWGFVLLCEPRRVGNKLRAYGWLVRNWDQVTAGRRRTQALRKVGDRELLALCSHRLDYAQVGGGVATRLARTVFDPMFFVLRRLALAVVRW